MTPPLETRSRGFAARLRNPIFLIFVCAIINTAAELALKRGASDTSHLSGTTTLFGAGALGAAWTWFGIVAYIASFVGWLYVLRFVPVSIAFPALNVVHVLVPIGSRVLLHEAIPFVRWVGIAAILAGIVLIIRPLIAAEEKL